MHEVSRKRRSRTEIFCLHLSATIAPLFLFFIPLLQSVLDSGDAQATIYWQQKNGIAADFDWANGGSDKCLFGEPTVIGNVFQFSPTNFRAESIDGRSAITSDRLQFDIIAHPGKEIEGIRITEEGDYSILFEGKVSASSAIFVTNMNQFEVRKAMFQMEPVMPISSPTPLDFWSGQVAIENLHWTYARVVLNNNLIALSLPASVTFIEKKSVGVNIEIIIPEPATITILSIGLLAFNRKKKINLSADSSTEGLPKADSREKTASWHISGRKEV